MNEKLPKRWAINGCEEDFASVCPKTWGMLTKGDDPNVRFCGECKKNVHLVKSREELDARKSQRCCVAAQDRSGGLLIGVVGPEYFEKGNSKRRKEREKELAERKDDLLSKWPLKTN